MKIFISKSLWQNLSKIILITSFVNSCAGIPGKNVKLGEYPDLSLNEIINLSLEYELIEDSNNKPPFNIMEEMNKIDGLKTNLRRSFNDRVGATFIGKGVQKNKLNKPNKCLIKVKSVSSEEFDGLCGPYYFLSGFTIFIFPYYCINHYQAQASLISYPPESSILGKNTNILPSQSQAKPGDYFLDENNRLAKLLKTYELKDKVHEYWSLIALLGELVVVVVHPSTIRDSNISTPERAKQDTENVISEALVRQVLNDAATFEECKKDPRIKINPNN